MRDRAPAIIANLVPTGVAICRPATSSGMKWPLEQLRKLRRRKRTGHEDPLTLRHVKKAFRQDVFTADIRARLPTSEAEDWVALSEAPSQNEENEAPSAAIYRMSVDQPSDAEDVFKDTQGIQKSSKYDAASIDIQGSTRIDSSPRSDVSHHVNRDPETIGISSPPYGSPMDYDPLKRRNLPKLIRRHSPDGHMTILLDLTSNSQAPDNRPDRTDHPEFIADQQDHLIPFDNETHLEPALDNLDLLDPILRAGSHSNIASNWAHYEEHYLDQRNNPQPGERGRSNSEPIPDRQRYEIPTVERSHHSEFNSEFAMAGTRNLLEPLSHGEHHLESPSDRQDVQELVGEGKDSSMAISDQIAHPEPVLELSNQRASIPSRSDHSEPIRERQDHPPSVLEGHDEVGLTLERQSRPESLRSQKSFITKDQQRRLRREARLHNLLSRALQTRARAYGMRSQLHQSRSEISNADEHFMRLVRERRYQGGQNDLALEASFANLQDARNKYGPLEDAYNTIEEQLNREEYEAKELEEKILQSETRAPNFYDDARSSSVSEDDSEASKLVREVDHPLYEAYLSRLGDADICRETLSELIIEHDKLLHAKEVRQRVGRELSLGDQVTLRNFPAAQAKYMDELRRLEEDIEHLRLECVREGLFGSDDIEDEGEGEEEIVLPEPSKGLVDPEQIEYNRFPLLLEKPEEKEDEDKSKVLLTDFKEGDVGDRINCWLLHKLRSSGLEVELLARCTDDTDRTTDIDKWQKNVLEFWFFDSTNLSPSAYQENPTHTAFPPSPMTDLIKGSEKRSGDGYLVQFVVGSSAPSQKLPFGMLLELTRMEGRSAITV